MSDDDAYLRDGRYCSVHGIDLIPPDRTVSTRRYCNQCPADSALGFPLWMVTDCLDFGSDPCPHCLTCGGIHRRTGRCGACGGPRD